MGITHVFRTEEWLPTFPLHVHIYNASGWEQPVITSYSIHYTTLYDIYYFLMSVYGWYNWVQKKDAEHYTYPIRWCTRPQLLFGIGFFAFFWGVRNNFV